MSTPPTINRLNSQSLADFPGKPQLLAALNPFIGACTAGLDNGLTFVENFVGCVRVFNVTCPEEWVPLPTSALTNGWAPYNPDFALAYRKTEEGQVEFRGLIKSGMIGDTTLAITFGKALAALVPKQAEIFAVPSSYAFGCVGTSGTGLAVAAGSPAWVSLSGVRYAAADRAALPWPKPMDLSLDNVFGNERPGQCIVLACTDTSSGDLVRGVTLHNYYQLPKHSPKESPIIRIPRIFGLTPGHSYRLAVLFLPFSF